MPNCNDVAAVSCIATNYTREYIETDDVSCAWHHRPSRTQREDISKDSGAYEYSPKFPGQSSARTSFPSNQVDDEDKYDRLWKYQHDRGQTPDGIAKTTTRNNYTARRVKTILCQCEVTEWAKSASVRRVMGGSLNGFSRHYCGADGACIGFALLEMYDTAEEASDSFHANRASEVIPELDSEDIVNLVDYVFRKHGGDS